MIHVVTRCSSVVYDIIKKYINYKEWHIQKGFSKNVYSECSAIIMMARKEALIYCIYVIFIQERHNLIRTQMFAAEIVRDPQNLICFPDIREFSCNRLVLHACRTSSIHSMMILVFFDQSAKYTSIIQYTSKMLNISRNLCP